MAGRTKGEVIYLRKTCKCPKCNGADLTELGRVPVDCPTHGREEARKMKCNKDGSEFFCHETDDDSPQKCECPTCGAKPGAGLEEVKREEMPGGFLVTYKCKKCGIEVQCAEPPKPPECKCPKCGNNNVSEFEELSREPMADGKTFQVHYKCKKCGEEFDCLQQDGGGDCKCPTCGKFDATELGREKAVDGPDGEVWKVRYKCNSDKTEFECMETTGKRCRCPKCGAE